jgi:hypothetical protein
MPVISKLQISPKITNTQDGADVKGSTIIETESRGDFNRINGNSGKYFTKRAD